MKTIVVTLVIVWSVCAHAQASVDEPMRLMKLASEAMGNVESCADTSIGNDAILRCMARELDVACVNFRAAHDAMPELVKLTESGKYLESASKDCRAAVSNLRKGTIEGAQAAAILIGQMNRNIRHLHTSIRDLTRALEELAD